MQTVRFRRVLWVLIALAAWLGAAPSLAQQTGQVTNLTIVSPPPATFNSANPFRTNRQILRIEYSHDGIDRHVGRLVLRKGQLVAFVGPVTPSVTSIERH